MQNPESWKDEYAFKEVF